MSKFMLGNVRHSLDDKNRGRIPPKFKEGLGVSCFIFPGRANCLYLFPEDKVDSVLANLNNDNYYSDNEGMDDATAILGNVQDVELDSQGRITLNNELKSSVNIKKDIVFVGKGTYVEIWAAEEWDKRFSVLNPENLNRVLENLKKRGA